MIEVIKDATIITKEFIVKNEAETVTKSDEARSTTDLTKYPIVWINDIQINSGDIKEMRINYNSFMPTLEMKFSDATNLFSDESFPTDNIIISVHKESNVNKHMSFKIDFKITTLNLIKVITKAGDSMSETLIYEINAVINVDDLYMQSFESYKGTSYNVLKEISSNMELGFASNITSTDDEMIWVNNADYKKELMKQIISKSYLTDNTFLYGYIDVYYNFVFVDIEKLLSADISEQMLFVEIEDKPKKVPLILTNKGDKSGSPLFIKNFRVLNTSTKVHLDYGYRQILREYNRNTDEINMFSLDSISDEDGNNIILKGNDNESDKLYDKMLAGVWKGKLDLDNTHSKYLESDLQNATNMKYMQKLKMKISLGEINYGLYRFQKVLIELYNNQKLKNADKTQKNIQESDDHKIINKLSGEWLIISMEIKFSNESGNSQELTLIKRELTEKYTFPRRQKEN